MNKTTNICNNCGKTGHLFHQCKLSITSYGIIVFRSSSEGLQFLMLRRKDSFGYIDFIRGKYSPYNIYQLQNMIDEMSLEEKQRLLTNTFDNLWKNMWGETSNSQYKNEKQISSKKFDVILSGIQIDTETITLKDLINNNKKYKISKIYNASPK